MKQVPQVLKKILIERATPIKNKPSVIGADPDIQRGQFNVDDPELEKIRERFATQQPTTLYAPITPFTEPLTIS